MKALHIFAIIGIYLATCLGWNILGTVVTQRTSTAQNELNKEVISNWGPPLVQSQPVFHYLAPNAARSKKALLPESSEVRVTLSYDPKSKGLLNYRTYQATFEATYTIKNPAPIAQPVFATFTLPDARTRYDAFSMKLGGKTTDKAPTSGTITEVIDLLPGATSTVVVSYVASGLDTWRYQFDGASRVRNFRLSMSTDFEEINFPADTTSPNGPRERMHDDSTGWNLGWHFDDVIGARAIGMDMPKMLNAGPVASRIAFFAPVSLLFFFAVLVIVALTNGVRLHPMHWFFLAAGCFAFQLLFAYLVDLVPALPSFAIAGAVSLVMVTGYLWKVAGGAFARTAGLAQFAYMVLFSYSFFFDGITGLTITIGAVITLALLMMKTAGTDWQGIFTKAAGAPPPLPVAN